MKIRNRFLISAVARLAAVAVRLWLWCVRYRYYPLGPDVDPHRLAPTVAGKRLIYAFWHENMLQLAVAYGRADICILISQHRDGQLIAETAHHLGFRTVRGSSTRNGANALREMIRLAPDSHIAITPDGPRGPRRQVHSGLVFLAARAGMAVVPVGLGFDRPWRMNSWDRFVLPVPFRRSVCVTGDLIEIPETADREQLDAYRQVIEDAINRANAVAEEAAATGHPPRPPQSTNSASAA